MKVFENSLWKKFLKGNFAYRLNVFILPHEFWDIRDVAYSFYRSFCLLFCFSMLTLFSLCTQETLFPNLTLVSCLVLWSADWLAGLGLEKYGLLLTLFPTLSFLFLSITITPFHSWQVVKLLSLFQESLLSAVSCVCIKCRYVGYYNMFQLALICHCHPGGAHPYPKTLKPLIVA